MKIGNYKPLNNVFLAPMAGVTDKAFRIICRHFNSGLVYTEMVSSKGLFYGSRKTDLMLDIDDREAPVVVQLFGSDPDIMADMGERINDDPKVAFIDINMGCPAPKIVKNCEGSALMREPEKAERVVKRVVSKSRKPVTVKIRKGWDETLVNAVEFARMLEASGAAAVAVHGRTRVQMYEGKADWEVIAKVKRALSIPVIGNGDVTSPESAKALFDQTGCDAIMVGRGALGNPWIFERIVKYLESGELLLEASPGEKLDTALWHLELNHAFKGQRGIFEMRKELSWYIKGMKNATHFKNEINRTDDYEAMKKLLLYYKEELMRD